MARRKLGDESVRKLFRTGGKRTIGVTLPASMIRNLRWQERQQVVVEQVGKTLIIKDWKK